MHVEVRGQLPGVWPFLQSCVMGIELRSSVKSSVHSRYFSHWAIRTALNLETALLFRFSFHVPKPRISSAEASFTFSNFCLFPQSFPSHSKLPLGAAKSTCRGPDYIDNGMWNSLAPCRDTTVHHSQWPECCVILSSAYFQFLVFLLVGNKATVVSFAFLSPEL